MMMYAYAHSTYLHGYHVQLVVIDECQVVCDDLIDPCSVGLIYRSHTTNNIIVVVADTTVVYTTRSFSSTLPCIISIDTTTTTTTSSRGGGDGLEGLLLGYYCHDSR